MDTEQFLRDLDLDTILENEGGLESVSEVFNGNIINALNKHAPKKLCIVCNRIINLGTVYGIGMV